MLKRFRISNFRNLVNVEFRPAGMNLLIGPNNVGKTNLCAALRFLSLTASKPLDVAAKEAVGETWNLANVYVTEPSIQIEIECDLGFEGEQLLFSYKLSLGVIKPSTFDKVLTVDREELHVSGGGFEHTVLIVSEKGQGRVLNHKRLLDDSIEHFMPCRTNGKVTVLSRLMDPEPGTPQGHFKRYLESIGYFNLNCHCLRSQEVFRGEGLLWDGRNLSRALFGLHNENPRSEKKIIDATRDFDPKLDVLTYQSPDPESVFMFMEDKDGHRFGTQSISDGTLRFMAIAYLVLAGGQGKATTDNPPVIIIEEPENGIYVGQLKKLLERIDPSGKGGQFIFTSQSPYFIDLFDSHLDGLHVFKPGKPSAVLVKPDEEKVKRLLRDMPLGELHFREMLA